jgi:hypothetical protein
LKIPVESALYPLVVAVVVAVVVEIGRRSTTAANTKILSLKKEQEQFQFRKFLTVLFRNMTHYPF